MSESICLLRELFVIFVSEIVEGLLHPGVLLGGALEVLQAQLGCRVEAQLGRDLPSLREVGLVAQEDPRQALQPGALLHLLQPGAGRGEALLPGDVVDGHHQGAAVPQPRQQVVVCRPSRAVDHHQLHGVRGVGDVDGSAEDVTSQGHRVVLGEAGPGVDELLDYRGFAHSCLANQH